MVAWSNRDVPVYVINLDRDHERMWQFSETNGHVTEFTRFSAVDGREADRAALQREGIISHNLTYNNGQLGCALSHIALWRAAAAENRAITVVEDDAILAPNFALARDEFVARLPAECSIALWVWNFDRSVWAEIPEGVAKAVLQFDQDALRANLEVFRGSEVAHAPVRLRHAFGSMAYTVSPAGAKALLEMCPPLARRFIHFEGFGIGIPNNGIDCMMNTAYPKLKLYVCVPPLAVSENRQDTSHTHLMF
jgi:GR25 family glycosyltransferase involved in LPS biosynthesis